MPLAPSARTEVPDRTDLRQETGSCTIQLDENRCTTASRGPGVAPAGLTRVQPGDRERPALSPHSRDKLSKPALSSSSNWTFNRPATRSSRVGAADVPRSRSVGGSTQ